MKRVIIALLLIFVVAFAFTNFDSGEGSRAGVSDLTGSVIAIDGDKIEIDSSKSSFEFEGYTPVKSHVGSFDTWNGYIYKTNGKINGIEGIIQASSVNTGIERLDDHLRADDFFGVNSYPNILFKSQSIINGQMIGLLTFRGVTKEIIFPATITDNSLSTEFLLDTTPFNMENTAVNKEVRIKFNFAI